MHDKPRPPDSPMATNAAVAATTVETPANSRSASGSPPLVSQLTDGALYPGYYVWYVFMAAMDVLMTRIILSDFFKGYEVNWLAAWIIRSGGMAAATRFKFGVVVFVILICEFVGRRHPEKGRRLARWAVLITAIPVVVSFAQLLIDVSAWIFHGDLGLDFVPATPPTTTRQAQIGE